MKKQHFTFNEETNSYEPLPHSIWQSLLRALRSLLIGALVGGAVFVVLYILIGLPSDKALRSENNKLRAQYFQISQRLDNALIVLHDIQQRDDNLYRVMLQTEPISQTIRESGYGNTNRYEELLLIADADQVINTTQKMDLLTKQLYIQSKSFDELVELCKNNEEMLRCIPSIQPIANKNLKHTASGYGWRTDPIYGTKRLHGGMDFSANKGTPVYVTGDGVVKSAGWETGYGNCIEVDHGFNCHTRYAHLSEINVKAGQKVARGEVIGKVGSTGKSTGPHLHYEVVIKGTKVNPVNYYFMDLSAEEYDTMVEMAANHGKVYD